MRDYKEFDRHLNALSVDIYGQPPDEGHTSWSSDVIKKMASICSSCHTVLDVGCGRAIAKPIFEKIGYDWTGITLGEDFLACKDAGIEDVYRYDMTFLPFESGTFDLVYARHVLEHSPFPLITLMEWRRVAVSHLLLVAPAPHYWGFRGKNHYSVMEIKHLEWLLNRAGWDVIHSDRLTTHSKLFLASAEGNWKEEAENPEENPPKDVEYQLLCQKCVPEVE